MTLGIERFSEFFQAVNHREPFPWQRRLAELVFTSGWPACVDLPTASGKTACIDIAVFVAACQAEMHAQQQTVGRRVFFTVNRRVIVDEAFLRSKRLAQKLRDAEAGSSGILQEVALALRSLNEESDPAIAPPLAIAQLRGGVYRDAAWARSLTQPIVICSTVDQLGSRMLFRGYGVSDCALPIHAALCTHDATILLDEAHVTRAFCETIDLVHRYQSARSDKNAVGSPFHYVQMTATPHGQDNKEPFQLQADDYQHPVLKARQNATKPAMLHNVDKKKSLSHAMSTDAIRIGSECARAVGIIVNRVQTARDIAEQIRNQLHEKKQDAEVYLVIGRMRPIDRDKLQDTLRHVVGPERPHTLSKSVYVVATQCLEVGADYDFDALLTECASIDALRQRFGRLNRSGRTDLPFDTVSSVYFQEQSEKGLDPIYGEAINKTWAWLQENKNEDSQFEFGIARFNELWSSVGPADRCAMSTPSLQAAVLLPAHLDLLCQTSPRPMPEPEIGYFIHGPQRTTADVNVCWRADLGEVPSLWADIVRLLPPTSMECMAVPIWTVRRWIAGQAADKSRDADVAVTETVDDGRKPLEREDRATTILRWRGMGDESIVTCNPNDIRPGDTIVIRVSDGGWELFGHIPDAPPQADLDGLKKGSQLPSGELLDQLARIDVAESCCRQRSLRHVVRLHPAFADRAALRGLELRDLRLAMEDLADREIDAGNVQLKESIKEIVQGRLSRHSYPAVGSAPVLEGEAVNEVISFQRLLPKAGDLELPEPDHDDEEDDRSQSNQQITLEDHTSHVTTRVARTTKILGTSLGSMFKLAAQWHDIGKADLRFQAMLGGLTPSETMERPTLLAKSDCRRLTSAERTAIRKRALLPDKFRHEFLSSQLVENFLLNNHDDCDIDTSVVLRLIESHHGFARPFAGVVLDAPQSIEDSVEDSEFNEVRSIRLNGSEHWPEVDLDGARRAELKPLHRLDSGVADRFWELTRRFGWWGLAYLETILRLADQRASAAEEQGRR